MFDSHIHLDFDAPWGELSGALTRARERGIRGWMVPGADPKNWDRVAALPALDDGIVIALGVHPWWATAEVELQGVLDELSLRAKTHGFRALGEIGLDGARAGGDLRRQIAFFEGQLRLARELELPVICHQVKAVPEFLRCLERVGLGPAGGVIHGFSGDAELARKFLERGLYLGVGFAPFRKGREVVLEALRSAPQSRLLLETDGPDQAPPGAAFGAPEELAWVQTHLAEELGVAAEVVAEFAEKNALELFSLGR